MMDRSRIQRLHVPFGILSFTIAVIANAEPVLLPAEQSPDGNSAFSLNFGALGGVASAQITRTNLTLEVDAEVGSARFVHYAQQVQPLTLPGGFSTGNIVVEIVAGSSTGSYEARLGEFTTTETYAVHFDGDLSAFGLTSPVYLPASSTGKVALSSRDGGSVIMDWSGEGQLISPYDPKQLLSFSYTCSMDTSFAPTASSLLSIALVPHVENLELPTGLERNLLHKLEVATQQYDTGDNRQAIRALSIFISKVEKEAGRRIEQDSADLLISDAQGTIELIQAEAVSASIAGGPKTGAGR